MGTSNPVTFGEQERRSRPVACVHPQKQFEGNSSSPTALNSTNNMECIREKLTVDCTDKLLSCNSVDGSVVEETKLSEILEETKISDGGDAKDGILPGMEEPTKAQKMDVARLIGKEWKALGRHLISRVDLPARLYDIESEEGTSEDKCFSVFSLWEKSSEDNYNVKTLIQALDSLPRRDILEYFKEYKLEEKNEIEIYAEDSHFELKCTEKGLKGGTSCTQNFDEGDTSVVVGTNASPSPPLQKSDCCSKDDVEGNHEKEMPEQDDGCLIVELGRKGLKALAKCLDPQHPNGNWKNVGRNLGVPEPTLKRIEDKRLIQYTPAFKMLEILPHYATNLTVSNLVERLEGDDMHQRQIANEIRKSVTDLDQEFSKMDAKLKEKLADTLMTKSPALGSWKDLADLFDIPYKEVRRIEEDARGDREDHSHTEGLILALSGRQARLTMEDLAKALDELPRRDAAKEVRRMIRNWNSYKTKK